MSVKLKFTAAGDAIIQRPIQEDFAGFSELTPFIMQGDARFFNLETTLNREGEAYGSQFSGGTYIRTNPEVLDGLMELGFNMTSFNNNHVLDFGYPGMLATLRYVEESGLVHAGVGDNLAAASAPRYLETKNGRVALIAVNTSFNATCMAGKQTERVPGRPGINGIRIEEKFTVTEDELAFIRALSTRLRVNVSREIVRREGYYPPLADNEAEFGELKFTLGDETKRTLVPKKADLERLAKSALAIARVACNVVQLYILAVMLVDVSQNTLNAFCILGSILPRITDAVRHECRIQHRIKLQKISHHP